MLEYLKNNWKQIKEEFEEEYLYQKREKDLTESKIKTISDLEILKFYYNCLRIIFPFVVIIDIILLTSLPLILAVNGFVVINLIPIVVSAGSIVGTIGLIKTISDRKKGLDKKYLECLEISNNVLEKCNDIENLEKLKKGNYKGLNKEILKKVSEILLNEKKEIEQCMSDLEISIKDINYNIINLEGYEIIDEMINETGLFAYKDVKNEEEYENLLKTDNKTKEPNYQNTVEELINLKNKEKKVINNLLEDYFEKNLRYHSVKTYNDPGDEIKYKERPKQFVKKM